MLLKSRVKLQEYMRLAELGQTRLSQQVGCTRAFIQHLVRGRKQGCSPELAAKIAQALGVHTEVLFGQEEASVPEDETKTGPQKVHNPALLGRPAQLKPVAEASLPILVQSLRWTSKEAGYIQETEGVYRMIYLSVLPATSDNALADQIVQKTPTP